jgi:hypothetical protein
MIHMMISSVYSAVAWATLLGIVQGNEGPRPTSEAIAEWTEQAVENEYRRREKDRTPNPRDLAAAPMLLHIEWKGADIDTERSWVTTMGRYSFPGAAAGQDTDSRAIKD